MKKVDSPSFKYNFVFNDGENETVVRLGEEPGWIDRYRSDLENAKTIALVPKERNGNNRAVMLHLGEGKRWIFFSRVFGQATTGIQVRFYAIGWQMNVDGNNIKEIVWVYPDGTIESGVDNPTYYRVFLPGGIDG